MVRLQPGPLSERTISEDSRADGWLRTFRATGQSRCGCRNRRVSRTMRGRSSVGRAIGLQPIGRRFDSARLHAPSPPGQSSCELFRELLPGPFGWRRDGFCKANKRNKKFFSEKFSKKFAIIVDGAGKDWYKEGLNFRRGHDGLCGFFRRRADRTCRPMRMRRLFEK